MQITLPVVFPTLVGVFLMALVLIIKVYCLPHARGGVSALRIGATLVVRSSPRSWGCFSVADCGQDWKQVFPTLVGVFPYFFAVHIRDAGSSPRSWGCF